ncbi:hypothetical protein VTK56DRAFT_320 [Thermocarpiscus australiensis]
MEETLEQMQARHRKEQRDLQSRITNKKKNATKKTRKGVNDECAELERQLKERQEAELRKLVGDEDEGDEQDDVDEQQPTDRTPSEPPSTAAADSLTDKPQKTDLLSALLQPPPPRSQPQPQSQSQQTTPQKQKRNRQKERLARRAAEQQAQAEAAASEASHMTDHRGQERAYMEREFAAHALRERDIAPDGHCLFSAVADQLEANGVPLLGSSTSTSSASGGVGVGEGQGGGEQQLDATPRVQPYRIVRRAAADWIAAHRDEYAGFLEEDVDAYVAKIRDTAEWGGQLELSALANAYGVEIRVVHEGRTEVVRPSSSGDKEGGEEVKTLWLAYYRHGYGLGEHYNSLRKAD